LDCIDCPIPSQNGEGLVSYNRIGYKFHFYFVKIVAQDCKRALIAGSSSFSDMATDASKAETVFKTNI
jgi:hypothetical protein